MNLLNGKKTYAALCENSSCTSQEMTNETGKSLTWRINGVQQGFEEDGELAMEHALLFTQIEVINVRKSGVTNWSTFVIR
jgi:hypothetical protein